MLTINLKKYYSKSIEYAVYSYPVMAFGLKVTTFIMTNQNNQCVGISIALITKQFFHNLKSSCSGNYNAIPKFNYYMMISCKTMNLAKLSNNCILYEYNDDHGLLNNLTTEPFSL